MHCLIWSEKRCIDSSHEESNIERNNTQPSTVLLEKKREWDLAGFFQFFVVLFQFCTHTCLNILQYANSLLVWQRKGDLSLKSNLQEFYSMLQKLKFISQFATVLIAIKVSVKDGQGLCISWAGLTCTSGKQSYSWKTFVYKSLKGQKQNRKNILYHLSLSINPSKTAKLQLAWYIL